MLVKGYQILVRSKRSILYTIVSIVNNNMLYSWKLLRVDFNFPYNKLVYEVINMLISSIAIIPCI